MNFSSDVCNISPLMTKSKGTGLSAGGSAGISLMIDERNRKERSSLRTMAQEMVHDF